MNTTKTVSSIALLAALAFGEAGESVSPYSGGIRLGAAKSLSSQLSDSVSTAFVKVGHSSYWNMSDKFQIGLDLDWLGNGTNFSGAVGADYSFTTGKVRPFLGAGVGAAYFDHDGDLGTGFGPLVKAKAGLAIDLTQNFGLKLEAPYQVVLNEHNDQTFGLDITLVWFGKFKNIKTVM